MSRAEVRSIVLDPHERQRIQELVVKAHKGTIGPLEAMELRRLMAKEYHNDFLLYVEWEKLIKMGMWLLAVWGVLRLLRE